jgi:hypothetical protein
MQIHNRSTRSVSSISARDQAGISAGRMCIRMSMGKSDRFDLGAIQVLSCAALGTGVFRSIVLYSSRGRGG